MKKIIIYLFFLLCNFYHSQTDTENYIQVRTYLEPVTSSSPSAKQYHEVKYFDGLGRPKQMINVKATPDGNDLVTEIEYDGFGRQDKEHLPMPQQSSSDGAIYTTISETTGVFLYGGIAPYYSKKEIENSPLDRILSATAPGIWSADSKRTEFSYLANAGSEVLKFTTVTGWQNDATITNTLKIENYYPQATLYKNKVTDEDGNISYEFKNGQGQTLLVRKINGADTPVNYVDTYYVYNEYDQLAFVIPPMAVQTLQTSPVQTISNPDNDSLIKNLCYVYKYDRKNRLVEKKLPGKGEEYMVYDKTDRLVFTQDANMRANGNSKWLFTKYDKFGRVIYTGFVTGNDRNSMQNMIGDIVITESRSSTFFTKNGLQIYYSNDYFPYLDTVLSVNYYDKYPGDTPELPAPGFTQTFISDDSENNNISTKGLPVASYVKNIDANNWTKTYTFYDTKGRAIGTYAKNHLGGYTQTESFLDFTGLPDKIVTKHIRTGSGSPLVIEETFEYDDQKRLTRHYHEVIGKSPKELLVKNSYNELGQLNIKEVGATNTSGTSYTPALQNINYNYNIRGWMTGINLNVSKNLDTGKLFSYKIRYNDTQDNTKKRYNGNIGEIDWTYGTATSNRYDYTYDRLNRLLKADFKSVGITTTNSKFYNEELVYDKNGNITNLKRYGKTSASTTTGTLVDNLDYTYNGNMATAIADATGNNSGYKGIGLPITYDENGNMLTFPDKGITQNIVYNFLNLPQQILQNSNSTTYTYRADGVKVKKHSIINSENLFTEYLDGFVYTSPYTLGAKAALEQDDDETRETVTGRQEEAIVTEEREARPGDPPTQYIVNLSFFPTAEGFYDYENFKYIYQYKDHLGNVRLSYSRNSAGVLQKLDTNDYYPFGLNFITTGSLTPSFFSPVTTFRNYKYNGKELQETGQYDYGARFYMPDIGRWGVVDDLSELQLHYSPYSYVYNNPVFFNDPTGMIGEGFATCPTCPNTKEFQPYINDPNNVYVYDPSTGKAEKEVQIQEVVITGHKKVQSNFAGLDFSKVASMLAPIRPASSDEQNRFGAYGQGIGSDLNIMWRHIKAIPGDISSTIDNISNISESEDKEEALISMAILMVNLKKGKIGNVAKMGVGKSTSGWVISKVFNSLDPAIQTKIKNAISKGIVAPTGQQGIIKLTATEAAQTGYQYKIKILGKGGDIRIYGNPNANGHIVFEKVMGH